MIFIMCLFISSDDFVKQLINLSLVILSTIVRRLGIIIPLFPDKDV